MDAKTIIDNLISAIEGGNADDIKETVGLAKLLAPGLETATPVATSAGSWYVQDEDDGANFGPFADEATARAWGTLWLDPHVAWNAFSPLDVAAAEQWVASNYTTPSGVAPQPAQPNLPAGYVDTANNPGARLKLKPPGTLYQN